MLLLVAACLRHRQRLRPPPQPRPRPSTPTHRDLRQQSAATAVVLAAATAWRRPFRFPDATVDERNFENSSSRCTIAAQPVDLSGWVILVGSYRVKFPTTDYMTLAPSSNKIVHLSSSNSPVTGDNLYLGMGAVSTGTGALTSGDKVVLVDPDGKVASTYPAP